MLFNQFVSYDIETFPHDESLARISDEINRREADALHELKSSEPPREITKLKTEKLREERLAQWRSEKQALLMQFDNDKPVRISEWKKELYKDASLHWTKGKIVSICASQGDTAPFAMAGTNEGQILEKFSDWCKDKADSILFGKSNHIFDDGFLRGRCMVNKVEFPEPLRLVPLRGPTFDIDMIFGSWNKHPQRSKLNGYCKALGLGEKLAEGSDVADMYESERIDEIREYNMQDVMLTREILKLFFDLGGRL